MTQIDRRAWLVAAAAVVLGVGGYVAFRPTDEWRIRDKLAKLAAAVRVTEADVQANPIGRLAHVSGLFEPLFEPDVRVSIPELRSLESGRSELAQAVTAAPRFLRTFDVDFSDITVKLDEAGASAEVGARASVKALDRDGETRRDERAVNFHFVKKSGESIITTVSVWSKEDAPR